MPADEDAESGQLSIWLDTEMTASRRKKPPYTDGLMKILAHSSVWPFLTKFSMELINDIVTYDRLKWRQKRLEKCLCSFPVWEKGSRNDDVGIQHDCHSADSSLREWVIHLATSSSVKNPAFSASPFICSWSRIMA